MAGCRHASLILRFLDSDLAKKELVASRLLRNRLFNFITLSLSSSAPDALSGPLLPLRIRSGCLGGFIVKRRDEGASTEEEDGVDCGGRLAGVSIAMEGSRDCAVGAIQLYPPASGVKE